jgi:hypothetical protein
MKITESTAWLSAEAIAPRGRLCALQEAGGRAWAGPDDLSGAVSVAAAGARKN